MRGAIAGLLVGAAFVLGGCQYLLGPMMGGPNLPPLGGSFDPGGFGSFDPSDPGFSLPPPEAIYKTGSATVKINGTPATYDTLTGSAALIADFGANATWMDGRGHYVRVFGAKTGDSVIDTEAGFVQVERIVDTHHWTSADPSTCKVTVTTADRTGFAGTATCTGLRWTDAITPVDASGNPAYVEGQAPFDLEVTFEAKP